MSQHSTLREKEGTILSLIPAGEYISCDSSGSLRSRDAEAQSSVYLDAFYLALTCVTNSQYRQFAQETNRCLPYFEVFGGKDPLWFPDGADNHPVHYVKWT